MDLVRPPLEVTIGEYHSFTIGFSSSNLIIVSAEFNPVDHSKYKYYAQTIDFPICEELINSLATNNSTAKPVFAFPLLKEYIYFLSKKY